MILGQQCREGRGVEIELDLPVPTDPDLRASVETPGHAAGLGPEPQRTLPWLWPVIDDLTGRRVQAKQLAIHTGIADALPEPRREEHEAGAVIDQGSGAGNSACQRRGTHRPEKGLAALDSRVSLEGFQGKQEGEVGVVDSSRR